MRAVRGGKNHYTGYMDMDCSGRVSHDFLLRILKGNGDKSRPGDAFRHKQTTRLPQVPLPKGDLGGCRPIAP
jgi:hypothetical protein